MLRVYLEHSQFSMEQTLRRVDGFADRQIPVDDYIGDQCLLHQVKYDMLVVAVGSINNTFGAPALSQTGLPSLISSSELSK